MDKKVRRLVMFCTILTVGLVLLFIEVTFIQLLLLMIALAIVLPFLLGMVTIAEVRAAFETFKEQRLKKNSLYKKLDGIKLFEKKGAGKQESPPSKTPEKTKAGAAKTVATGKSPGKWPFSSQIGSIVTTLKSLGTSIRQKARPGRKVADINKMLDSTVNHTVDKNSGNLPLPAPGGAGSASSAEADPFMSLSDDEFDSGLLDGLDDEDMTQAGMSTGGNGSSGLPDDMALPEPELSMPDLEMDSAAADILKENAGDEGLDGFSGLDDGGDAGNDLDDLDSISLDDVDLDADLDEDADGEGSTAAEPVAAETPAPAAGTSAAQPTEDFGAAKASWIPSDAPGEDDLNSMQSDMASFAGGSGGTDEDLLSSIASDVKRTVKERDLSLLRELKDFKAPAEDIETELTDLYQRMGSLKKPKNTPDSTTNELK
ncbi:MAG: hypothetical protein M0Q92_12400 [Methanoregula sp.]|jgi:hypothetical protein|nr:hypothetical protein [Methanoregula sp.]